MWRFRRVLFLLALLGVAGISGVVLILANVPLTAVEPPVETSFILDADNNKLAELSGGENRVLRDLDEMSPTLVDAVLAAEDRDFFSHPGIDLSAIVRATMADLSGRPLQGGSTITQQYVKNVYVGRERTLARKLKEAALAVKLERKLDKREILERYLNTIYFGRGAYGAQAAARSYFAKDVGDLTVRESAYLAGLIRAPEAADASRDPQEADARRDRVLVAMAKAGFISPRERADGVAEPVDAYVRPRDEAVEDRIVGGEVGTQYFVEYVRQQLYQRYGEELVTGGGLQVHTTLDLDLQRSAYEAVYGTLDRPDDPAGALVALDADGNVRAMVGGRRLGTDSPYAKVNFAMGTEGGGSGRQAGSAFKPFVLAEAVRQGYSVRSMFASPSQVVFPGADAGRAYTVRNYDNAAHGSVSLLDATRVSSNTVYAQLAEALGPARVAEEAGRLGIRSKVPPELSVALGTAEVSALEMADAFLTFATRGLQVDPLAITEVTDSDGELIDRFTPEKERVLEPQQADVVNHVLQSVVTGGTATRADFGRPVAAKTGTTQGNGDAWLVGFTPGLSTAVWMGYPEGQSRQMGNVHGIAVTGGTLPAEIFRKFMSVATADPRYGGDFVEPASLGGRFLSGRVPVTAPEPETTTTIAPEPVTAPEPSTAASPAPTTVGGPTTTATTATTTKGPKDTIPSAPTVPSLP
ncbi:MAG: transglycosylase domain-containing protein [Acidimicrobiales bacterium]